MNPGPAAQKHSPQCELVSDSLRLFGTLQLKVIGWSMLPTVWPGDTIVVSTADFSPDSPRLDGEQLGKVHFIVRHGKQMEPSRKISCGPRAFAGLMQRSTSAARVAAMARHLYQSCRPRELSHPCQS